MIPLCFLCMRSCSRRPGAGLWRRLVCGPEEFAAEVSSQGQPACPALQMDQVCNHYTHNSQSARTMSGMGSRVLLPISWTHLKAADYVYDSQTPRVAFKLSGLTSIMIECPNIVLVQSKSNSRNLLNCSYLSVLFNKLEDCSSIMWA